MITWLQANMPATFKVQPWYRDVIRVVYGENPSQTVVSISRGNGKTMLAAALAVYELLGRGLPGAQVLIVATTADQARNCFDEAVNLIHHSETLTSWSEPEWHVGYARRRVPHLNAYMTALPAQNEGALQGYTPTLAIVDEVGWISDAVWVAMQQACTKREEAHVLGVGTPGYDRHGVMYQLRTRAREDRPAGLRYLEWAAPEGCRITDRRAWLRANPALRSGIKSQARMAQVMATSDEQRFRMFQLGQWVGRASQWLPWAAWGKLARQPAPADGEEVALGFDGSESGDSTALCWATREAVGVVQVWERLGEPGWRVPRDQVVEAVLAAFGRWNVRVLACDPHGWRSEIEAIEHEVGDRVQRASFTRYAEFAPACDRFYQAVMARQVAWDGSEVLSRHLSNAVPVPSRQGTAIAKPYTSSRDHIDAGVAAILAYEWAARTLQPPVDLARTIW